MTSDTSLALNLYNGFKEIADISQKIIWDEGLRHPVLQVGISTDNASALELLIANTWVTEINIDGRDVGTDVLVVQQSIGKIGKLTFQLPVPNEDVAIVKNLDALLEYNRFLINIPRNVFFIDTNSSVIPGKYIDAVSFSNTLKRTADHFEDINEEYKCYFYNGGRVVIPIKYSEVELQSLEGIHDLQQFFSEGPNLNEKIKIFKSSIFKQAMTCPSESRTFVHLLNNFSLLKNTFDQDWSFYLSEFSFDDILDELEEKILKISDKISSSLSDLQRIMITIPLAIIFAAPKINTTGPKIENITLVASVLVFSGFTSLFLHNHKKSLNFLIDEIDEQKELAKKKHQYLATKVKDKFDRLCKNCEAQSFYRNCLMFLLWLSFVIIFILSFFPDLIAHLMPTQIPFKCDGYAVRMTSESILTA